jgi:multiple sugar transport system ATP-binding protein
LIRTEGWPSVLIKFDDVSKRFDGADALSHFNVQVPDGSFLVLLGPSGCGKTTAMRIAAGLEQPSEGRVLIGERDVTDVPPRGRDLAMVFQSYALYPHMSVAENIGYPLRIRKVAKAEIRSEVERVAEVLDLGPYLARKPRQLSGGQRQRVALARAIIRHPVAFLMDEPLSNLDAQLRVQMRTEIKRLQREFAVTTLYVTHDQVEAMTMADQVAVLRQGVLQQLAPPHELYDRPANAFVARFTGSPPMNILPGTSDGHLIRTAVGSVPSPAGVPAGEVQVGFRPEAVSLVDPTSDEAHLRAPVYALEPLGNELIVAFQMGDELVHVRLSPDSHLVVGENCGLRINPAKIALFDVSTGSRLDTPLNPPTGSPAVEREFA